MKEATIKKAFLEVINAPDAEEQTGLTTTQVYNYRKPERHSIKNMVYVLHLANKLKIK